MGEVECVDGSYCRRDKQCEQCWISGTVQLEELIDENKDYLATRKRWVNIFCERYCPAKPNFLFSEQVAFIAADYRTYQAVFQMNRLYFNFMFKISRCLAGLPVFTCFYIVCQVNEFLQYSSERLLMGGAIIVVPSLED